MLSDAAITQSSDDLLSRATLVERICKLVVEWTGADGLVVSLEGDWGEGKTSVLNLIEQRLIVHHPGIREVIRYRNTPSESQNGADDAQV